jgi:GntR family transcriptional regulator
MQTLRSEGLITRTAGKGTFVGGPERARFSGWSISSVEELVSYGRATQFKLLSHREVPAADHAADALDLAPGTPVVEIKALRSSEEGVVVYQRSFVLLNVGRAIQGADFSRHTVLSAIEQRVGLTIDRVLQAITAVAAGKGENARLLGVQRGAPLLHVERLVVSNERGAVTFGISQYRCDRYRHIAELTRLNRR